MKKKKRVAKPAIVETAKANLSREAFQAFVANRKAGRKTGSADPKPAPLPRARPMVPTDERLAKQDRPRKTQAGFYRAPPPIERLRDQKKLDPIPHVNEGMFQASVKLYRHFYEGGLGGIRAQDVSRVSGSGGGDGGACGFPQTDNAMHHRQKFREATRIMGWFENAPHRGAGRLAVDICCFGVGVKEASRVHIPGGRNEDNLAAGMDRLREGLYALAAHWNLF